MPRHIRRPKIKLRTIVREKRCVPPALLLRQNISLRLELRMRCNRPRLRQNLTTLNLVPLHTSQKCTNVVPRLTTIQELAKHLYTSTHRLRRLTYPYNLNLIANPHNTSLYPTRHNRPTARNRKHILYRHQKRAIHRTLRRRYIRINFSHQLQNRRRTNLTITILQSRQRRTLHHRYIITRKIIQR